MYVFFSRGRVAEIKVESHEFAVQDEIKIIGETTGVYEDQIQEIRLDLDSVQSVVKGNFCSIPVKDVVRRNDKVFKVVKADKSIPNLVQK